MRRSFRRSAALAAIAIVAPIAGTVGATTVPGDTASDSGAAAVVADPVAQSTADEAIAGFETRMTDAGFVNIGPTADDDGGDSDDDSDDMFADGDLSECGDDIAEMVGGLDAFLEGDDDDSVPGQLAMAESDQFAPPGTDAAATTETTDFSMSIEGEEVVVAMVAITDGSSNEQLDDFVRLFGSPDFAECFEAEFERSMAEDFEGEEAPPMEIAVTATPLDGVGDLASEMTLTFSMVAMFPISIDVDWVLARQGDDLVMVAHTGLLTPITADIDLAAEAEAILADLAAA